MTCATLETQQTDGEVAQAGERARGVPHARPATILVIGHVAHGVQAVLDGQWPRFWAKSCTRLACVRFGLVIR